MNFKVEIRKTCKACGNKLPNIINLSLDISKKTCL